MTLFAIAWEAFFLNPAVVWVLIPITAILISGIQQVYKQYCRHVERIAMIENGIHPDEIGLAPDPDSAPESEYNQLAQTEYHWT